MKTAILAKVYADACLAASTEETRYYLRGVCLEPSGHAVATNGHILLAVNAAHDPDKFHSELPAAVIIPFNKDLLKACRAKNKTNWDRYLVIEHGPAGSLSFTARVIDGNLEDVMADAPALVSYTWERACFIDGTFPDWRRVLPDMSQPAVVPTMGYNPEYLATFGKAANGPLIGIRTTDARGPAYVELGREDAFGVIMPGRLDVADTLPAWVKAPVETAKKEAA